MKYLLVLAGFFFCLFSRNTALGQSRKANDTLIAAARIIADGDAAAAADSNALAISLYQQVPEGDSLYGSALYRAVRVANSDSLLYATGLALAHRAAALPFSDLHPGSMLQLASSYTLNGYADSAEQIYRQFEVASPHAYHPLLERGLVYLRQKRYPEAISLLEEALVRNPLQGQLHQSLSVAYLRQRRLSEAYLSLITSLFFTSNPASAGSSITLLSAIANSNLDELSPPAKPDAASHPFWDETDDLLLSRLPLSKDYQFKSTLNEDPLVKVLHALLEKLPSQIAAADTNFAMQIYAPLFAELYARGNFDELVQYAFSGYGIEAIEKAAARNKKALTEVREKTFSYFNRLFETGSRQVASRAGAPSIRYRIPGEEDAIMTGNLLSTDPLKWGAGEARLYSYGILEAVGLLDEKGEKTGTWNTYYGNGQVSSTSQFKAGEKNGTAQTYYLTGIRSKMARFRNDTSFYEEHFDASGRLNRIASQEIIAGKSRISQIRIHPNGTPQDTTIYIADERADGPMREWDAEGKLVEEGTIRQGFIQGSFRQWYPFTHLLKAEGTLEKGDLEGTYTRFYTNGRPSVRGTYHKGRQNGWEEEWNEGGTLKERNLYKDGDLEETQFMDEAGRLYERIVFEKGLPHLLLRRDAGGKMQEETQFRNRGAEVLRLTHANGKPKAELPYVNGKVEGTLRYFAPSGLLISDAEFAAGEPEGWKVYYHPNGRVKSEQYRSAGKTGRFRRFKESGLLEQESFSTFDNTGQGPSTTFSAFGKPLYTMYRNEGVLDGPYMEQDPLGNPLAVTQVANDLFLAQQILDTTGRVWQEAHFPKGNGTLISATLSRQIIGRDSLVGGRREGLVQSEYAPGKPLRSAFYRNGFIEGELTSWFVNGQRAMHDTERRSNTEGIRRTWDEAGNLTSEATYVADEQKGPEWRYYAGTLRAIRFYESDILEGPYFMMWGPADTLARLDYAEGHLLRKQVRDSLGNWKKEEPVAEGTTDLVTYFPKGGRALDYHYKHNVLEGTQRSWNPNGKLAEEGEYQKGCLEGTLKRFYADGTPYLQSRFEKDNYEGEELIWFPNGKMCSRNTYLKGMRHGPATYYDKEEKQPPITFMYRYDRIVSQP